jgi:hypothetical protein
MEKLQNIISIYLWYISYQNYSMLDNNPVKSLQMGILVFALL